MGWATFLSILVFLWTFRSQLTVWANIGHTDHVTLRPWSLTLEVIMVIRVFVLQCSISVSSLKFVGLPIRKIWRTFGLSISRPVDLDLSPWNCSLLYCHLGGQPFYQFWCLCAFSLSTYGPTPVRWTTWPCDLDPWPWRSRRLSLIEILILCLCTMLELSRSEDIAHLLCEH